MKEKTFYLILLAITLFGFVLRSIDYDKVPPEDEAFDEVHYAWGGATWIKNGVPKSWSNFGSYKNVEYFERYGIKWRLVWPLIEKPPLYFWLSGLITVLSKPMNIFDVNHSVIRLLPLILSIPTIFLTGILARKIFNSQIAILATLLYGITPAIVLANRMSVTENLITPLALLALLTLANFPKKNRQKTLGAVYLGIICFLSILTKQIGIAISFASILLLGMLREYKATAILIVFSLAAIVLYVAIGAYFDWHLFWSLQKDVRIGHTFSGLPEVIPAIFRFPTIGPKNHPFLDGTILLGNILLFSSPLWIIKDQKKSAPLLLSFPFAYLLLLTIGESASGAFTFFGWYLYPLFPFLIILIAKFLHDFWQKPTIFPSALIAFILGASTIRFIFLLTPRQFHYLWQYSYIMLILLILVLPLSKKRITKSIMICLFALLIIVNLIAVLNLPSIYQEVALNDQSLRGFNF